MSDSIDLSDQLPDGWNRVSLGELTEIDRESLTDKVRSLNLASTVNTIVYEAVRQFGGLPPPS